MPPFAVWTVVGLLAVLVAAAVPALLQLKRTLATVERTLESTGRRVDQALDEMTQTLDRVNRVAAELEHGSKRIAPLFEVLGGLGDSLVKMKASVAAVTAVGAAIGPMLWAGIRAWLHRDDEPGEEASP